MKTFLFIVLFLFIGAFFIISNQEIALNSSENVSLFFNEYGEWIDSLFGNGKVVVGYVAKMEWLPGGEDLGLGE
tara:strand:+ start:3203 stop:3424 length:222 start_codon:yes stop_codon:yes gene_type:complete